MNQDSSLSTDPSAAAADMTAVEQAVRARALQRIRDDQERPKPGWTQRLLIASLTVMAVTVVVLLLNFVVTGMHRIMDIWYPGSISGRHAPMPSTTPPALDQPFMIGVVSEDAGSSSSTASQR